MRLPVDECGNRISNEEFTLNYIVDFTEADFAQRLIEQINSEMPSATVLSSDIIHKAAQQIGKDGNLLLAELLEKHYVSFVGGGVNIIPENKTQFFEEYPVFKSGLETGKVKDRNAKPIRPVKIKKGEFEELRELWNVLNQRYTIRYDAEVNDKISPALDWILASGNIFSDQIITSRRDIVKSYGGQMSSSSELGVQYNINQALPYGVFLKRISQATNIPVKEIHEAVCRYSTKHGRIRDEYFNEQAINIIVHAFYDWKINTLLLRFRYGKTCNNSLATALTYADGSVREEITQGRIGIKIKEGDTADKYLYDTKAYDSPIELENIEADIDGGLSGIAEVVVYGKIPKSSIAIPTITGSAYSPDFMYVVRKTNGDKELNIVVETKDVGNKSTLRGVENVKVKCAEIFFKNLSAQGYNVHFRTQTSNEKILKIVKDYLPS